MPRKLLVTLGIISGVVAAVFLLLYLLTMGEYPVARTVSQQPDIPHVEIDGIVFHAESFGDPSKPVVIVIHGGPGWDYRSLLPIKALADKYHVVFYDQRGTGLSPRVGAEELSLELSIHDLNLIVDYFGKGQKVNLIGHSWGAMLASAYLAQQPHKVTRAVLAEPGFLTTEMAEKAGIVFGPKLDVGFLLHATKVWFQTLHIDGPDEEAPSDYFLGHVAPYANPEYYCEGVVPAVGVEHWRVGSRAMFSVLSARIDAEGKIDIDLRDGVENFKGRVLFLASECNTKLGAEHQKKQMQYFPSAELAVVAGSGHMMFGEKPEESIEIVRAFLNGNGP